MKESFTQSDGLLVPWLRMVRTQDVEAAESELALLIEAHIEPVIRGVIRFKLRPDSADEADLAQEALAQWLAELRKLGARPDEHSIGDARGLAATITYRVCYGWLRRRSPRHHALRNRLQYVLTRQEGLAIWTAAGQTEKKLIAGFAAWRGRAQAPSEKLRQLPGDETFLTEAGRLTTNRQEAKLNDLLSAIFDYVGGPVAFDELLSVTATLLQIRDEPPASTEEKQQVGGAEFPSGEDVAWQVEKRIFLERLWEEVRELPVQQRAALLLNLREADGRGCLALFPATGVATLQRAQHLPVAGFLFTGLRFDHPRVNFHPHAGFVAVYFDRANRQTAEFDPLAAGEQLLGRFPARFKLRRSSAPQP